jgi:dTMP kinase
MWIDFEGIDGSGKTTVSVRLARALRERGRPVHHPREGGGFRPPLVARIRDLTRAGESALLSPATEFLLNAAREAQLLEEEIRPALARGEIVVTDRALHAHVAAAGLRPGLAAEEVRRAAALAAGGLWPDRVILVDVDPDVARIRKRLRKVRDRRLGTPGRKGLQGRAFLARLRAALRTLAESDPARWRTLDNSFRTPAEAETEALALVADLVGLPPPPRPPAPQPWHVAGGETPEERIRRFFDFTENLFHCDPATALLLAAGLDHPRADVLRARGADRCPDVAAWSASGLDTPAAWELRRATAGQAPYHVARGLAGLTGLEAWAWREALAGVAPDQVLHSLAGLSGRDAHALRERLWDRAPDEGLRSLAGLGDGRSWGFRCRALRDGPGGALAESLAGLGAPPSWRLRDRLRREFPLSVLRSLRKLDQPRAWTLRESLAEAAPKAVLETFEGLAGPAAEALRDRLQPICPDEVAEGLAGLDRPEAWRRRSELVAAAPEGVLAGLSGVRHHPEAERLAEEALSRAQGRPLVVRQAVQFYLKRARAAEPEGIRP